MADEDRMGDLYTVFVVNHSAGIVYCRWVILRKVFFDKPGRKIPFANRPIPGIHMDIEERTLPFDIEHPLRAGEKVTCYLFGRSREGIAILTVLLKGRSIQGMSNVQVSPAETFGSSSTPVL